MLILPILLAALIAPPDPGASPDAGAKSRSFTLTYRATVRDIPAGARSLDVWLPVPQTDRNQTIHQLTIDAPGPLTIGREGRFGNHCLHIRVDAPRGPVSISWTARVTRRENRGIQRAARRRGARARPRGRAARPAERTRAGTGRSGDGGPDDRRGEGPGDLRHGHRDDAVRQDRDGLGTRRRPVRLRRQAGQLHRLPRPGHRHGALGRHPGPVRHRPVIARSPRRRARPRSAATTAGPSCMSTAGAGSRWTPARP